MHFEVEMMMIGLARLRYQTNEERISTALTVTAKWNQVSKQWDDNGKHAMICDDVILLVFNFSDCTSGMSTGSSADISARLDT